jgi:tRNA threonylcarbamoyladenosine biosynthesis protein TsaE
MSKNTTLNLSQIPEAAKAVAKDLKGGEIFALVGTLGAGKTTFVKAVGKALKMKHLIPSPTFILLQAFEAKLKSKKILIYHLDLYRTNGLKEAKALGLTEFWGKPNTVTFIEWADKIKKHLPTKTKFITFKN